MSEQFPIPELKIFFIPFCDGGALFYPGIQRLWALNHLASYIWLRLDENISKDTLISDIAEEFSIDTKIVEYDVAQLLAHFKEEGLLGSGYPTQPNTSKDIDYFITDKQLQSHEFVDDEACFTSWIEAYGFTCEINFPDKNFNKEFQKLYHYFLVDENEIIEANKNIALKISISPSDSQSNCLNIYLNEKCIHQDMPRAQVYSTIHFIYFSNCAKYLSKQGKLMFHAAALHKDDKTIVMPANSGSGKSTLTAALSSCGWHCYTDELAVLDSVDLSITPLPIPFRVRSGSFKPLLPFYPNIPELPVYEDLHQNEIRWIILPKEQLVAEDTKTKISSIVFPKYSEASKTVLKPLDKFIALERLTATGSSERDMTLEDAKAMVRLIEQTPCYELIFSDLQEAITAIESITNKLEERHSRAGGKPESK